MCTKGSKAVKHLLSFVSLEEVLTCEPFDVNLDLTNKTLEISLNSSSLILLFFFFVGKRKEKISHRMLNLI